MNAVADLGLHTNTKAACAALGVPRATYYRQAVSRAAIVPAVRPTPPLALSAMEEQNVLDTLHGPRFRDFAPPYVYATLLDEGIYHCSIRTMYRIMAKHDEVRERRRKIG